jgi:PAS domain S-box-containing protein
MATLRDTIVDDVLAGVNEGVLVIDEEWTVRAANDVAADVLGVDRDTLDGSDVRETFPESVEATFQGRFSGDAEPAAVSFEEYFPARERWLSVRTRPLTDGMAVYVDDVTERRETEQAVADREAELDTLDRINTIVYDLIEELAGATSRESIETTVCERLAASDLYEFVWIAEREAAGDRLYSRTAAGEHGDMIGDIVEHSADPAAAPERAAVETGSSVVVDPLGNDERVPKPIRRTAFARGLQSGLAVPLGYGDAVYGVLSVYAAREGAFSERERTGFDTLGQTVGFAINAARQRNLLLSDTVVEVTLRVGGREPAVAATAGEFDCTLIVEGTVPMDGHRLLEYLRVDDADPEAVLAKFTDTDGVESGRVVATNEDGGLLEVIVHDASPVLLLAEQGATIRTAAYDGDAGRLIVDFPPDENVRTVYEELAARFPETELVAKRERERTVETAQEFQSDLHAALTDKQHRALRTAYLADYFQSPRDSTAEEVAETLDISSATLHYHLRAAQRKLLDRFFDDDSGGQRLR